MARVVSLSQELIYIIKQIIAKNLRFDVNIVDIWAYCEPFYYLGMSCYLTFDYQYTVYLSFLSIRSIRMCSWILRKTDVHNKDKHLVTCISVKSWWVHSSPLEQYVQYVVWTVCGKRQNSLYTRTFVYSNQWLYYLVKLQ